MNFNELMQKMRDLDQPTIQSEECGAMPPMTPSTPPATPPSMSVNLNAQGMDGIKDLMQLFSKVNPDMMPKNDAPMPTMTDPIIKIGAVKTAEPNKMLAKPEESWENEPDEEYKGMDAAIRSGNDIHKSKKTFPKVAGGDNPMQRMESQDELVKSIEAQLKSQLEEMKGNR
jgi:hypothetical protein